MTTYVYAVQVRDKTGGPWIPWASSRDLEVAMAELRRCAVGFSARVVRNDGMQIAALIHGGGL